MMNDKQAMTTQQDRLAALYEVSSQLGASLDLSEVLNQVMDAIIKLTGAERGFLMLFDEDSGRLKTSAARNVDQETIDDELRQISRTVVERAVASGEGILTDNAQEDERFASQQSVVGFQLRSIMCAPLRARGGIIGAVYVDNRLFSSIFESADLDLLVAFANQAAIAIENARLFTQTDQALARRVEELSLSQRIDQQLNKSLDLNRVLSLSLDWAINLTQADSGSIGLLEAGAEETDPPILRLMVHRGEEVSETRLVAADHPILAQILQSGQSVTKRNVGLEESIDGTPAKIQLAVPIKNEQDGRVAGLITLENQHADEIGVEDVAFVERLADRATVAINNARLYEAVQAANQAKSDFVSLVTHELRLPMTSIKGYSDLIASGMAGELNEQQQQFFAVIQRNLQRMGRLISDLSDINRVESGRMIFENQLFALPPIIEDVVANMNEAVNGRNQTLSLTLPDDLPEVYADPNRIGQVLSNLVSNAHKYTPDDGRIQIQAQIVGEMVRVDITDNGLGISEADQAKLFTQFFRAEEREVREQTGWGLGLSIVKKIVEAQGGQISFTSQLGQGSTFSFTIPLTPPAADGV
jgi:signal transduction histidine kinase